jgi:hypothetical protein
MRHWKLVGLMVLAGIILCAATYAEKEGKESKESKKVELPAAVKAAVEKLLHGATIGEAEMDEEEVELYAVELKLDKQEMDATVAADGLVAEVKTEEAADKLPKAVADAIKKAVEGATIKEVEKEVTYAEVKLVKLDTPKTTYSAEVVKDGKVTKIEVTADGKILEQKSVCKDKDKDEKDDDKDDNNQK